jgi:rare lipoprotein A
MRRIHTRSGAQRLAGWAALALVVLAVSGCRHKNTVARLPPPQTAPPVAAAPAPEPSAHLGRIPITPVPPGGVSAEDLEYVSTHEPLQSEEGMATWYTAPYAGRKAANGQVFDDHAMTAAERTLPMGSLITVTNLKTGQTAAMRVTDRGPFVEGTIIDLTIASAKATGIYRSGSAHVRVDVYRTPKPIGTGGRWCVQIGAFKSQKPALKLKQELIERYPGSQVIEFPGESSYWVRIRPQGDNREMAEFIADHLRPAEGEAYLTRLD